jgi:hypothetical protein
MGVSKVTITFVSNFQEKAHSGRTTLMLKEKKRTQSNKEATFSGQSTWISCKRDQKWVTWQEKKANKQLQEQAPWQKKVFGENRMI